LVVSDTCAVGKTLFGATGITLLGATGITPFLQQGEN
jgi:hypothetical protein